MVLAMLASAACAQETHGRFVAIGSMTQLRWEHTATLLADGGVLIAGGFSAQGVTDTAELFYPSLHKFVSTGNMHVPRVGASATLPGGGKVLIAGGTADAGDSARAELYHPAKGVFAITGSMVTPRIHHSATLLANGKVLVVGGARTDYGEIAGAELYDSGTGRFSPTGSMQTPEEWPQAVLLNDGKVLIVSGWQGRAESGGLHFEGPVLNPAELYEPKDGIFSTVSSQDLGAGANGVATLMDNGSVLITGGFSQSGAATALVGPLVNDGARLYNPPQGSFRLIASMHARRISHTSTRLRNEQVLIAGSSSALGFMDPLGAAEQALASTELYDPARGVFIPGPDMTIRRTRHTATLLGTGEVLITGGKAHEGFGTASAELYLPEPPAGAAPALK